MREELYEDEKRAIYSLDHLINICLSDRLFTYTKKINDRKTKLTMKVKSISISEEDGVYVTGNLQQIGGEQLKSDETEVVTIIQPDFFELNSKLRERLETYIDKRPRMRIIPTKVRSGNDIYNENCVMVLYPQPIKDRAHPVITYNVVKLYDEEGDFMTYMFDTAKDVESKERLYHKSTIQGRFHDESMYNAITLALRGYTRGIIKDGVIYAREVNGSAPVHIPISSSHFNFKGYDPCSLDLRIELEKFGCPVKTIRYHNDNISYIRITNILGDEGRVAKYEDIIREIRGRKTGIVYLKDTLAEEVLNTFYPCINPLSGNDKLKDLNESGAIFGGYITNKGDEPNYANTDLDLTPLALDNLKYSDKNTKTLATKTELASALGITDNTFEFYIIDQDVTLDQDILISMCATSLVFILSEFNNLSGLSRLIKIGGNKSDLLIENIIFAGCLNNDEGIFIHPYIKKLMSVDSLYELNRIPLNMSKTDVHGNQLRYTDLLTKILATEDNISEIILTDKVQVVRDDIIMDSHSTFEEITYGDLIYIYTQLTNYDMSEELETKGIYKQIVQHRGTITETKGDKVIKRKFSIPFKMTVTQMRNVLNRPPIKISVQPIITTSQDAPSSLCKLYTSTQQGIFALCGNPSSGKKHVAKNICQNLPNIGRVLILDSEYEITEHFFRDSDGKTPQGFDLTISRSQKFNKIEEMVKTRPDTIIVYKVSSYDNKILKMILDNYSPTQQLILVHDGLFTDLLEMLSTKSLNKILSFLTIATNLIKVKTTSEESPYVSVYECIDQGIIEKLTLSKEESSDASEVASAVYNHMRDNSQGLLRQLAEMLRNNNIDKNSYSIAISTLRRPYIQKSKGGAY